MAWVKLSSMVALIAWPVGSVCAQTMTSAEIKAALEGNSISNENEVQYFDPDGTAAYRKGDERASGRWGIEGDKFCSDLNIDARYPAKGDGRVGKWRCYLTTGDRKRVSFIIDRHAYSWVVSEGDKVD